MKFCNVSVDFQENDPTLKGRVKKSDAREMQSFYQHYYKKYIQALQNAADKADRYVHRVILHDVLGNFAITFLVFSS